VSPHPAVDLVDPFTGRVVDIDIEMVPVISSLWSLRIRTSSCCQGWPGEVPSAVICFAGVGRTDEWGLPRSRYRKGRQGATRLVVMLADVAPDDRWRAWRWDWDEFNQDSGVVLPNQDLPWLGTQLERLERAAAGQLELEEAS
jgi:hypothetical protein